MNEKEYSLGESLNNFWHKFDAPKHLMFDGFISKVGKNTRFFKNLLNYLIKHHISDPWRSNENPAECNIRENKCCFY